MTLFVGANPAFIPLLSQLNRAYGAQIFGLGATFRRFCDFLGTFENPLGDL
jgi:hypothetical protein